MQSNYYEKSRNEKKRNMENPFKCDVVNTIDAYARDIISTMRKVFFLSIFFVFVSCNHTKTAADFIELGKSNETLDSIDDYCGRGNNNVSDEPWIKFMFLNNPYNLGDRNIVSIYINGELCYRGKYKYLVDLHGNPDEIFSKWGSMVIRMEILTDKTTPPIWVHRFQSKTVFSWNDDYKIIYCVFCPTNEDVEKVYFIPQFESVI